MIGSEVRFCVRVSMNAWVTEVMIRLTHEEVEGLLRADCGLDHTAGHRMRVQDGLRKGSQRRPLLGRARARRWLWNLHISERVGGCRVRGEFRGTLGLGYEAKTEGTPTTV